MKRLVLLVLFLCTSLLSTAQSDPNFKNFGSRNTTDPEAQFILGKILYQGTDDIPRDVKGALYWFTKAADQGHLEAQGVIGALHYKGGEVPVNYSKAFYYLSKAAIQGDRAAQLLLGVMYSEGRGVTQDYSEAILWYELAMVGNDNPVTVFYSLGLYYELGLGTKSSITTAKDYYSKACKGKIQLGCDAYKRLNTQ